MNFYKNFITIALVLFGTAASNKQDCEKKLFLNEFTIGRTNGAKDFLEFVHEPNSKTSQVASFNKYKAIIISNNTRLEAELTFSLSLINSNARKSKNWILTASHVRANNQIGFDKENVSFDIKVKALYPEKPVTEFLPNPPFAILILCEHGPSLLPLKVKATRTRPGSSSQKYSATPVTTDLENLIADSVVDGIIYTGITGETAWTKQLINKIKVKKPQLTISLIGNIGTAENSNSINRCGRSLYKWGTPTFGKVNNCASPTYANTMNSVSAIASPFAGVSENPVQQTQVHVMDNTALFQNSWAQDIDLHQKSVFDIKVLEESSHKVWFEYLKNGTDPTKSRFRCRICYHYYQDKLAKNGRYVGHLATEKGYLPQSRKSSSCKVRKHQLNNSHLIAVEYYKLLSKLKPTLTIGQILPLVDINLDPFWNKTAIKLNTVITMNSINTPCARFKEIIDMQNRNGLSISSEHVTPYSCRRMIESISDSLHEQMLTLLTSSDQPISIILDAATDSTNYHYLAVYFQFISDSSVKTMFYKLLHIGADETAAGLKKAFIDSVKQEDPRFDLYGELKRRVFSFVSDGASVMNAKTKGLLQLLEVEFSKKIFSVHCMAHRIQLVVKKSLQTKTIPGPNSNKINDPNEPAYLVIFKQLEDMANDLWKLFDSKNHANKESLRSFATEMHLHLGALSRIHDIRWAGSKLKAYKRIKEDYLTLARALRELKINAAARARELLGLLTDKNLVSALYHLIDVLDVLTEWSLWSQTHDGTIVGTFDMMSSVLKKLEYLKTHNGIALESLLFDTSKSTSIVQGVTLAEYESETEKLSLNGVELKLETTTPALSTYRVDMIDRLVGNIKHYFTCNTLEMFEVFSPKQIGKTKLVRDKVFEKMSDLCEVETMKCTYTEIYPEYVVLIDSIRRSSYWQAHAKDDPRKFWAFFLNIDDEAIEWSRATRTLLHKIIVIPMASAIAERGFSVMKHSKDDKRNRMLPDLLDHVLRLKLNGDYLINELGLNYLARKWVQEGHYASGLPHFSEDMCNA